VQASIEGLTTCELATGVALVAELGVAEFTVGDEAVADGDD
jgi:hypothetical protein